MDALVLARLENALVILHSQIDGFCMNALQAQVGVTVVCLWMRCLLDTLAYGRNLHGWCGLACAYGLFDALANGRRIALWAWMRWLLDACKGMYSRPPESDP